MLMEPDAASAAVIPESWVGHPEHFRWLEGIVRMVLFLNLADALLTIIWIRAGLAHEANPLLASVIAYSPVLFVTVKTSLVSLGSLLLWRLRYRPLSVIAIFIVFLAYYFLLLFHLNHFGLALHRFAGMSG